MNPSTLISRLFEQSFGVWPETCEPLPASGSDRQYFRIRSKSDSVIGAFNPDKAENKAFTTFTHHFRRIHLPVPSVLANDPEHGVYLLNDLGDETLYDRLTTDRKGGKFPDSVLPYYKEAVRQLPQFQITGAKDLDFSVCYPRDAFDTRSMLWDLNYFKYYFLKLAKIPFDEQKLEDDFALFCNLLSKSESNFFLYRDFQSRNIMIHQNQLWFIDYQGGRRGALPYDLASLLYDAKADIPNEIREILLEEYINSAKQLLPIDEHRFRNEFYSFVLIRILQALGAYGFRGFYEQKNHFLLSIPYAVKNLTYLLNNNLLPSGFSELTKVLERIINEKSLLDYGKTTNRLTVDIWSFSFKKGIPVDKSGNGGGFVFDCRGLPNPGRLESLKDFTGNDQPIIEYLEKQDDVKAFALETQSLAARTIENYLTRGFSHLMISFGCTGGKHRSVFLANQLAGFLKGKYNIDINLRHREQESRLE